MGRPLSATSMGSGAPPPTSGGNTQGADPDPGSANGQAVAPNAVTAFQDDSFVPAAPAAPVSRADHKDASHHPKGNATKEKGGHDDEAGPPKVLEYSHEYLMHGWEGLHSAEKLADLGLIGMAAKGVRAGQEGNLAKVLGSEMAAKAVGTGIGVLGGVQAVAGAAVAADAVRRKDWAQAADGVSHVGEGGFEAALALKLSKGASFLETIKDSRALPVLGVVGAVGHAFHNAKEAKEPGHELKWVGVAGDVVSAAGGVVAAVAPQARVAGVAVAAGGMLVDIVTGFADNILHPGDDHHGDGQGAAPHHHEAREK